MRSIPCVLLLLLLVTTLPAQAPDLTFTETLLHFDNPYQTFVSEFCGWQKTGPTEFSSSGQPLCFITKGHTEYASFMKARKQAMKLFGLVEPR